MKGKRLAAFFLASALTLTGLPRADAMELNIFTVSFGKSSLTEGEITASTTISRLGDTQTVIASLGYYKADGTLSAFDARVCELEKGMIASVSQGTAELALDIPSDVEEGDYIRVVVMNKDTLSPYDSSGTVSLICQGDYSDVETEYTGLYERYYTLESDEGCIAMDGKTVTVSDDGTEFRLKDMGEGYVAFVDATSDGKRRLNCADGALGRRLYGFGGTSMLWQLEEQGDKYYIKHYDGGYLAIENGSAVISETPTAFGLVKREESPFTLMTSLDGFKLLSDAQKQRIIEIYTSVGAEIFPNGTNASSILEVAESSFTELFEQRKSLSAEEQRDKILEIVQTPPSYNNAGTNEMSGVSIASLPNGNADITQSSVSKETLYIWDTGTKEYSRIDATYSSGGKTQTVRFYYDESGEANVQSAIEALARFPYEYRQFIEQVNVYVPESGSYTYNCDGKVLTVRVASGTGVESMARNFAHELGHSVDFCANGNSSEASYHWCQGTKWQTAVADDMAIVSEYGNSYYDDGTRNYYEELAEFARLYFQSYGNRERQLGVKQLYPNQYASFGRLLNKLGMEQLY